MTRTTCCCSLYLCDDRLRERPVAQPTQEQAAARFRCPTRLGLDHPITSLHAPNAATTVSGALTRKVFGLTTHSNRLIPIYTFGTLGAGEEGRGPQRLRRRKECLPQQRSHHQVVSSFATRHAEPKPPLLRPDGHLSTDGSSARAGKKRVFLGF